MTQIPDVLDSRAIVFRKYFQDLPQPLGEAVQQLLLYSDFAYRNLELLQSLLAKDSCLSPYVFADYLDLLAAIQTDQSQALFGKALRQFRNQQLLRLMLRELAGLAQTEETMTAWSACADALILHCLDYCQLQLEQRYGAALDEKNARVDLYTLAMGKLGGSELNFSSDIDLIFAFSAGGYTAGPEVIANQQFFNKLVQQFMQIMQNQTPEGFVFRVDLRLRPNGDSGPLVTSLAAMETYYQEQGRDWERYAMVKARAILRQPGASVPWFERLITPFVYRRYVDFSVIESLRSMKAMIEREVQLNPRLDDIKRGRGGIREIEFIIQNFQLIRGGRLVQLRHQNAMQALASLQAEQLLPRTDVLAQAYLFFRRLENTLQMQNDQQTHVLPQEELKRWQLVLGMGYASWESLIDRLHQYQRIVSHAFRDVLQRGQIYEDEKRLLAHQLQSIWQGHVEATMAVNVLSGLGYEEAERCYQMLYDFRHAPRCRRLSQGARMRLDKLMVLLLSELASIPHTDRILLDVLRLLDNIVGRSAYLALLTENVNALKELLYWFGHSSFITSLLVNQPFLLEVLLDDSNQWRPTSVQGLRERLAKQLARAEGFEQKEEILREFKLSQWLLAARAELRHQIRAVTLGRFLSDVARVILEQVYHLAFVQLEEKHPEVMELRDRFAIVAYGKFGSREMNYTSDLDLVFLHEVEPSKESLVTRLTQKILHMLTTRLQSGLLYSVDTRLRPSGSAGLLVSSISAFRAYQLNQAWVWEHQALTRARVVAGPKSFSSELFAIKQEVLLNPTHNAAIAEQVSAMRKKIGWNLEEGLVKYPCGGLLDLEFLVQYWVLTAGQAGLAKETHTLRLLLALHRLGLIDEHRLNPLQAAYRSYHRSLHRQVLGVGQTEVRLGHFEAVSLIWTEVFGSVKTGPNKTGLPG